MANMDVTEVFDLGELRHKGVLWAINRHLFHPMGYALALVLEDDGSISGWQLMGAGDEVWSFAPESDDEGFEKFQQFLNSVGQKDSNADL